MRINSRNLALVAVVAGAIAPAGAVARPDLGPLPWPGLSAHAAQVHCFKDYSRNSVTGDYCAPAARSVVARPESKAARPYTLPSSFKADVPTTAPSSEPAATLSQPSPAGFDWPSAGIGAAAIGGLLLVILGATVGVSKRRRQRLALREQH